MASPSEQTILITGANGFVAGHIVRTFVSKGYNVRGTVRSESSIASIKTAHPQYASQLSFAIVPDMTKPEAYETAFEGVTGVMHTASPFVLSPKDNVTELLEPAINGVTSILSAAHKWGKSVKRVVLTSSFASILDLSQGYRPGYTYTEEDWNPMTFSEASTADGTTAYCASKGLAERAAWDWIKEHKPNFGLATLCPAWIFGPNVAGVKNLSRLNESTEAIWKLINSNTVPPTDFAGFADVRDVAKAHLLAFEKPEAEGQRFILGSHFDYQTAVDEIREEMPELRSRVPEGKPGAGKTEQVYQVNGSKVQKVLGLEYTPLRTTMKDTITQLVEAEKAAGQA